MRDEDEDLKHYEEAYKVVQTTKKFGELSKIAGFVSAGLIFLVGLLLTFVVAGGYRGGEITFAVFLISLIVAAVVGSSFYGFGVLLVVLSENLSATLNLGIRNKSKAY